MWRFPATPPAATRSGLSGSTSIAVRSQSCSSASRSRAASRSGPAPRLPPRSTLIGLVFASPALGGRRGNHGLHAWALPDYDRQVSARPGGHSRLPQPGLLLGLGADAGDGSACCRAFPMLRAVRGWITGWFLPGRDRRGHVRLALRCLRSAVSPRPRPRKVDDRVCEAHPAVRDIRLALLATRDAHGLYERHGGFAHLEEPGRWMARWNRAST
jgi:hypothetical protein